MKNKLIYIFFSLIIVSIFLFPISINAAIDPCNDPNSTQLCDPFGGKDIPTVLQSMVSFLIDLAVPFSVLMGLVAGGFFLTAGGSVEKVKQGMAALTGAVVGLVVVIIASPILGLVQAQLIGNTIKDVIYNIVSYLQTLGGPLAIVMFLWGGFLYMTGVPAKIKTAMQIFLWVSVGIIIIMAATSIELFVKYFLS